MLLFKWFWWESRFYLWFHLFKYYNSPVNTSNIFYVTFFCGSIEISGINTYNPYSKKCFQNVSKVFPKCFQDHVLIFFLQTCYIECCHNFPCFPLQPFLCCASLCCFLGCSHQFVWNVLEWQLNMSLFHFYIENISVIFSFLQFFFINPIQQQLNAIKSYTLDP